MLLACLSLPAQAQDPGLQPPAGARLPLDLSFLDETGHPTTPGRVLAGLPGVLIFADWTCTALCGTALGLAAAVLPQTGLRPGQDYALLAIGLDPRDTPQQAATMRDAQLSGQPALMAASRFLSGDAAAVQAATSAMGLRARLDPERDQFTHPAALLVLAPDGRLSALLPAFGLDPDELREALAVARAGGSTSVAARALLLCNAILAGSHTAWVRQALMAGGMTTLLVLGAALLRLRRQGRRA
jgi:protein SCO1/2